MRRKPRGASRKVGQRAGRGKSSKEVERQDARPKAGGPPGEELLKEGSSAKGRAPPKRKGEAIRRPCHAQVRRGNTNKQKRN